MLSNEDHQSSAVRHGKEGRQEKQNDEDDDDFDGKQKCNWNAGASHIALKHQQSPRPFRRRQSGERHKGRREDRAKKREEKRNKRRNVVMVTMMIMMMTSTINGSAMKSVESSQRNHL